MITTKNIIKKFLHSVRWNTFETVMYHGILLTHQVCLYRIMPASDYGLAGTLFASLYLAITVANMGFDQAMSSFFSYALQSKQLFKKFVGTQVIISLGILVLLSFAFYYLQTTISPFLALLIGSLLITESTKKTLLVLLQLAFFNKHTTAIEVSSILLYVATVWIGYLFGIGLTLYLVFVPMLISSVISVILLCYFVNTIYQNLPSSIPDNQHKESGVTAIKSIIVTRLFTWLNQISHSIFSSNFLVPLFAYQFGLTYAGILKLVSTISHSITSIVRKIGGITSSALFAHTKTKSHNLQQQSFLAATSTIHQLLYGIIIFFSINYSKILAIKKIPLSGFSISLAYFFLMVTVSESLFIAYEAFLITHQYAHYVALFNMVTMGIVYIACITTNHAPLQTIVLLLAIRIITFGCLSIFAFYRWQLKPSWQIKPVWLALALVASFAFFILV